MVMSPWYVGFAYLCFCLFLVLGWAGGGEGRGALSKVRKG